MQVVSFTAARNSPKSHRTGGCLWCFGRERNLLPLEGIKPNVRYSRCFHKHLENCIYLHHSAKAGNLYITVIRWS